MKKFFFIPIFLFLLSCSNLDTTVEQANNLFKSDIATLKEEVDQLELVVQNDASAKQIQQQFLKSHEAYKKVEILSEYYFPTVSKAINGPALDEYEIDEGLTVPPEGFQVIEEFIFPTFNKKSKAELLRQLGILKANLNRLELVSQTNTLTDSHIFDAIRLEVFRIVTLGITGFDSPIAQNSLPETSASLESIASYCKNYASKYETKELQTSLTIIEKGKKYLQQHSDFNAFDRAYFIKEITNPLSKNLYQAQIKLHIPFLKEVRGLKATAQTLFEKDVFDAEAFSGFPDYKTTPEKIKLGKELFNDPILSGNNTRSCASCHHKDKSFTDGLEKAKTLDGKSLLKRNTPTLSNIAFQRAFFYDSRVSYIEDQAVAVISNENEMHGSLEKSAKDLKKNKEYTAKFKTAFPNNEIDAFTIKNALGSYIRSLSSYDSKFDGYMRNEVSFTAEEKAGFNLFAGKAKCATCHFIPLTNGTVPPNFTKSESEVLGVPNKYNQLDSDLGKFELTKALIHKNSFKTPTIRNITLTAPYMHNGVFKTLEEVIDFYNEGGGKGLGFSLENQTLPEDKLNLTDLEKKQLIAFMKTLTDTEPSKKKS
ncbi:cytochrome-c peroxidase [Flavobacterium sp. WC2509]|uniref:cytochrome-c peroxidase n=1 Tax=Flavobacterium sp. WC2509 TaxID=3461406 RepID=UPI0040449FAA